MSFDVEKQKEAIKALKKNYPHTVKIGKNKFIIAKVEDISTRFENFISDFNLIPSDKRNILSFTDKEKKVSRVISSRPILIDTDAGISIFYGKPTKEKKVSRVISSRPILIDTD